MANAAYKARANHTITVCTTCRHEGQACFHGFALIERLSESVAQANQCGLPETFSVSGTACMAGCSRPCTVAFQADGKATYLFGDIDTDDDIDALVAFAKQYERSEDGWTRSAERPAELSGKTLARIPAMVTIAKSLADG